MESGTVPGGAPVALPDAPMTVADRPLVVAPPTVADRPFAAPRATVADRPSAAPAEPPRILRRPAPLAPAPVDIVPRNPSPPPVAGSSEVDPDGPTLIRRPARFEERMYSDVTQPLPRRETPAAVEGLVQRSPSPPRPAPVTSAPPRQPIAPPVATAPAPAGVAAALPPIALVAPPALPADLDTSSTATVPKPELAPPPVAPVALVLAAGWRLAVARAVDLVLTSASAAALLLGALSALELRVAVQPVVDQAHSDPMVMLAVVLGAPFFAVALYQAVTVLFLGGTIGGRMVGLRVVRQRDGARPGAARALVRGLAAAIGALAFGSGPLWGILIDRRRRGLGDIVARSVTVQAGGRGTA